MTNIIKFEIETDASYNSSEKEDLLDEFLTFMKKVDQDVIDGTESIEIVDSSEATVSVEDKVQEALESTGLVGTVTLQDSEGKILRKIQFSEFGE